MPFRHAALIQATLAQDVAADPADANVATDPAAATDPANNPNDVPGEIDVDVTTVWGTIDNLIDGFLDRLPYFVIGLVVFGLFYLLAKFVRSLIRRFTDDRKAANLGRVLGRVAQWVILFVGLLVALAIVAPSVKPGDLLATLGIGGVAIGFAFKDILQNFLAGILILLREPFRVGDQIVSGSFEGTVESIETRATYLRTYDGHRVVIPNSDIYTSPVTVKTHFDAAREQYAIGIGYGDDLPEAMRIILETVKSCDGVLADPAPDVLVTELAGSAVNITARWWSKPQRGDVVKTRSRVIEAVKLALDEAGIDMPYPTQVLLFHNQTEQTDGDRTRQREGWPAGENPPAPRPLLGDGDANASNG